MRSYTNSDGMPIEVSENHLENAVSIKIELQNASPSRRCNWKLHKEMMETEGFGDSDTNESYRCLVKAYQREVGLLPSIYKHVDMVADSKLESVRKLLGDLSQEKRENQVVLSEYRKVRKNLSDSVMIAEAIRDAFLDERFFNIPRFVYEPTVTSSKKKAIMFLTDWHIGATVNNVSGNSYNWEIANKRMELYKKKVIEHCRIYNITDLSIVCLGDMIEHISMRNINQAFESEFNFSVQISKATDLIIKTLVQMSEFFNVDYTGISGNHDRTNGDKKANIDGDNAMFIINDSVRRFIEITKSPRIIINDSDEILYSAIKEVNGVRIKFLHGDWETRDSKNKLESHMAMDEDIYDALVMGHYHTYSVVERNHGKLEIYIGSPMGRNNYSKKIKGMNNASQGIMIVHEDGEIEPKRIDLQNA